MLSYIQPILKIMSDKDCEVFKGKKYVPFCCFIHKKKKKEKKQ